MLGTKNNNNELHCHPNVGKRLTNLSTHTWNVSFYLDSFCLFIGTTQLKVVSQSYKVLDIWNLCPFLLGMARQVQLQDSTKTNGAINSLSPNLYRSPAVCKRLAFFLRYSGSDFSQQVSMHPKRGLLRHSGLVSLLWKESHNKPRTRSIPVSLWAFLLAV